MKFKISDLNCINPDELARVVSHYQSCWEETYSRILTATVIQELLSQANSKEIGGWLTGDGKRKITLAHSNNQIVGAVACNCIHNRCYVWGMYVLESFQGYGVGGSLLQSCFEKAITNQCSALEVMVIQSSTKAVEFYLSSGFAKLDQTTYEIVAGIELASWRMERKI